jgi:hypothetical protein
MQFHVLYEPGTVNYFGSNVDYWDFTCYKPNWLSKKEGVQHIVWQLNDLPLTQKWIEAYKYKLLKIHESRRSRNPFKYTTVYDLYTHVTEERLLESYRVMNSMIEYVNGQPYTSGRIDISLKLREDNLESVEIDKLNRLHEEFETIMKEVTERRESGELEIPEGEWNEFWLALQSINLIVHYNEKINDNIKKYLFMVEPFYFTALKWEEPTGTEIKLTADDYKDFTLEELGGDLWLDFGTVGKDLFHCFCTNDIELVQQNMVSAQWELKPWVSYSWTKRTPEAAKVFNNEFQTWVKDRNVSSYLDVNDPKYTPGRHRLGTCISHNFKNSEEFMNQVIAKTPKIRCYYLTDDEGNSIYETN